MTLKEAAESVTRRLREAEARRLVTAGRERDEFDEMSDELEKHPIGLPRGRPCPECAEKDAELRRELAAARNDLAAAWRELDKTRERVCYLERLVRDATG